MRGNIFLRGSSSRYIDEIVFLREKRKLFGRDLIIGVERKV